MKREVTRIHFWCLNSAVAFSKLTEKCRSVVLTSGTLSPMESFASELETAFPIRLEASHVIDTSKQLWAGVFSKPNNAQVFNWTYKNSENLQLQDALGYTLINICKTVPKGVLVFFTSYGMLHKVSSFCFVFFLSLSVSLNLFLLILSKMENRWKQTNIWNQLCELKSVFTEGSGASFDKTLDSFYMANGVMTKKKKKTKGLNNNGKTRFSSNAV